MRGRGAVDFVGHQQLREDRPFHEAEGALAVLGLFEDLGAENVGRHQVWRELDTAGRDAEHGAERVDQLGLGEAGDADQQSVAAGEDGEYGVLDNLFLAEDHLADLGAHGLDAVERFLRLGDHLFFAQRLRRAVDAHARLHICTVFRR